MLRAPDTPTCGRSALPLEHYLEPWVTDRAIELLRDAAASERPFFVACSWNAPHFPMLAPAPYDALYDPAAVPLPPSFGASLEGKPAAQRRWRPHTRVTHLSPDGWRRLIAHYWGLATLVDAQVGRLLAALDELGVARNTVVVYTSDHGDMMGSHGLMEKGAWGVYEETVRVPLVIRDPRRRPQRPGVPELVSQLDLLPTLLELAGVQGPNDVSGRSAAGLMDGPVEGWRDAVYGETAALSEAPGVDAPLPQAELDPARLPITKWLRTARWKYAYRSDDLDELYDLAADPHELRNLAADPARAPLVRELRGRLATWMEETRDPLLPKLRPALLHESHAAHEP